MAYTDPALWVDGSGGGTPVTAAALNLRDNNVRDHQTRISAVELAPAYTSALVTRMTIAPVTVTYATSITLNAALGCVFRVTATGDLTLADITNGIDGQAVVLEVLGSGGARTITITGSGSMVIPSGTWWSGTFRYNATAAAWSLS